MSFNGVVEWFSRTKGYGFVKKLDSDSTIFIHKTNVNCEGFANLFPGEYVSFDVENKHGKEQCVKFIPNCTHSRVCDCNSPSQPKLNSTEVGLTTLLQGVF